MSETKKALIFQGGWDGHEPALVARRFKGMLERHGYACEVSDTQDVLADAEKLMGLDLIVPCWTMGEIKSEYTGNIMVIIGNTSIDITSVVTDLDNRLSGMDIGGLLGLWFQSLFVGLTMNILSICIMLVVYGRMIEIYLVTSLGPIPLATIGNSEWRGMGQGYLKSLFALGFQAFLIMVVTGIYAVLVQNIAISGDVSMAIWECMGYTVLLCFCLFKTGSIAKAVFAAH